MGDTVKIILNRAGRQLKLHMLGACVGVRTFACVHIDEQLFPVYYCERALFRISSSQWLGMVTFKRGSSSIAFLIVLSAPS
mmetsp:Transcript_9076/g.24670  ORF Transcript_9076/g.24670 Transcript_9076/m.24670 type:complete len:81 (-) Transcript_9076:2041-2283(-)